MSTELLNIEYVTLNKWLVNEQIGMTASEFHGLVSGILCGGNRDDSIFSLVRLFAHDDQTFSAPFNEYFAHMLLQIKKQLDGEMFDFRVLVPDDNQPMSLRVAQLAGWSNHFLLGLGLMQPKLDYLSGDRKEAVQDLKIIGQVNSHDDFENIESSEQDYAELVEHVRLLALYLNGEFLDSTSTSSQPH